MARIAPLCFILVLLVASCGPREPETTAERMETYIEVVTLNPERDSTAQYESFHFLADAITPEPAHEVEQIRITVPSREASLDAILTGLASKGHALGANAFQLRDGTYPPDTTARISVALFAVPDAVLDANRNAFPEHMVYILGALGPDDEGDSFKLNGEDQTVAPLHYLAVENAPGGETEISVGGLLGADLTLQGREDRPDSYWTLSGFGVGPYVGGPPPARASGMGLSFNTGRIHPVPPNAGRFFVQLMQAHNTP